MAHERLFRLGIASNLIVFAADVVLITALYVVLERVNRNLALLAAFFRLIETTILIVTTLNDFDVLRVLSGADYLRLRGGFGSCILSLFGGNTAAKASVAFLLRRWNQK